MHAPRTFYEALLSLVDSVLQASTLADENRRDVKKLRNYMSIMDTGVLRRKLEKEANAHAGALRALLNSRDIDAFKAYTLKNSAPGAYYLKYQGSVMGTIAQLNGNDAERCWRGVSTLCDHLQ